MTSTVGIIVGFARQVTSSLSTVKWSAVSKSRFMSAVTGAKVPGFLTSTATLYSSFKSVAGGTFKDFFVSLVPPGGFSGFIFSFLV